jgi:hypothetical protein
MPGMSEPDRREKWDITYTRTPIGNDMNVLEHAAK